MSNTVIDIKHIQGLEESLWLAETRFARDYLNRILDAGFFEFGRSGRVWTREQCIDVPPQEINEKLPLIAFKVTPLDSATILVTYISEVTYDEVQRSNRSSIGTKAPQGWKIRFHQGTPVPDA